MYRLDAEIVVEFQDIDVYQNTINFLIEKLEKSITVSKPNLYHSPGKLNELRWVNHQNCLTQRTLSFELQHGNDKSKKKFNLFCSFSFDCNLIEVIFWGIWGISLSNFVIGE